MDIANQIAIIATNQFQTLLLLLIIVFLMILLFLSSIRKSLHKPAQKRSVRSIEELAEILLPLNQQIKLLKSNKITTQKEVATLRSERDLYSGAILNFLNMGIRVLKGDEIVFENEWSEQHQLPITEPILNTIKAQKTELIQEDQKRAYLHLFHHHNHYVIIVTTDITERRRMEQRLRQREKLAYLGEISASIAHEFKNALGAIKGFTAALKRKPDHPDFVLKVADNISDEVEYFHQMLNDYLNYTREIRVKPERFPLNELLDEIVANHFSGDERIKYPAETFYICGDRDRMKQVLLNVIKNSVEAEEVSLITIDLKHTETESIISIIDDGEGIDPEDLEHLLEPFYSTKDQGTGLGLPICHHIITAHGGDFEITAPEAGGCRVTITLPKRDSQRGGQNDDQCL